MNPLVCEGCGARLAEGALVCDLCGTTVGGLEAVAECGADPETMEEIEVFSESSETAPTETASPLARTISTEDSLVAKSIFCNECGWKNPATAKFCSRCGDPLDATLHAVRQRSALVPEPQRIQGPPRHSGPKRPVLPTSAIAQSQVASTTSGVGRQVGILVGAGVLLILALFMITVVSQGNSDKQSVQRGTPSATTPDSPPPPLSGELEKQAADMVSEIVGLTGQAKIDKQRELVRLYAGAQRFDMAGDVQEQIATISNTEQDWILAGNLNYDWMDVQTGKTRSTYAQRAIAGYEKALAINPDNLDVKTDMAIAYMYDPQNPMKASQITREVLTEDPNHVQANFNLGIMLLQISRTDQAIEQFEKVKKLIGNADDPVYKRAENAIASIKKGRGS